MKRLVSTIIIIAIAASQGLAQTALTDISGKSDSSRLSSGVEGRISLDLRNIDIVDALKFLAMKAGMNIVATRNVTGRVTLMVEEVQIKDIFDIMLRSNGLAFSKERDIYNVMTEQEYAAIFGKRFADVRQVKVFRLQYAIPEQAFSLLEALKSDIGRVLVEPDSGTVMIMDTPENLLEIEKAMQKLEERNIIKVFDLKYARARDIEDQLKAQLDAKKVGTARADERSNQIIVQALAERMQDIEVMIAALDTKTRQVLIDTKIVKVKLSDSLSQGINWEGIAEVGKEFGMMYVGSSPFGIMQTAATAAATALTTRSQFLADNPDRGVGSIPLSSTTNTNIGNSRVAPGERIHVGIVDEKRDLDVLVKYLQTLGNTQVLSNPKLAVVNNHEARIHVGERQAYVTSTTTTGQATTTVSEEVTFVDVGIQLAITPTINDDGFVTMKVKPEVSSVVSELITPSGNRIPIIDTSMAETTVMVKDGTTIIIGGLRREDKKSVSDQVPYLGKIPFLGFLFKSSKEEVERTELLVMMTPYIVTGDILTTGDDGRDFGYQPIKEYQDYEGLSEDIDIQQQPVPLEEMLRTYIDYSTVETKGQTPGIKGVKR